jgi:hypothetical protein
LIREGKPILGNILVISAKTCKRNGEYEIPQTW